MGVSKRFCVAACIILLLKETMSNDAITVNVGVTDQCAQQTFLEDFHSNSANLEVHDANAEHLEIAFTILNDTHGLSTQEFYEKTIEQLKQKYAKLTKLRLRGGYVFKTNNPKSSDALKEEIDHLSSTLKSIDKAVNEQGIRLRRLVLTAVLGFEGTNGLNVADLLKHHFPGEALREQGNSSWSVPFKIQHGRGVLKLSLTVDKPVSEREEGRSRYYPVNMLATRMGPGPMLGSASYDAEKNVTRIWTAKSGQVELEGNHMDSEELEEYFPRNFNDE